MSKTPHFEFPLQPQQHIEQLPPYEFVGPANRSTRECAILELLEDNSAQNIPEALPIPEEDEEKFDQLRAALFSFCWNMGLSATSRLTPNRKIHYTSASSIEKVVPGAAVNNVQFYNIF